MARSAAAHKRITPPQDEADALIALAQEAFDDAARSAIAENERLGQPNYGGVQGRVVVRAAVGKTSRAKRG